MEKYTVVSKLDEVSKRIEKEIDDRLCQFDFIRDDENPETVIVVGGDGTFIYAVHQFMYRLKDVRFYGLHTGTLGFYSDYQDHEVDEFLDVLIHHEGKEEILSVLRGVVNGNCYYALNEIRVENAARTQVMDVYVNDIQLETFRGTGMCVCTQLGSTAYNRSLGGAVLQEGLDLIEMVEIVIRFESESFEDALLGVDSDVYSLEDCKKIEIKICGARHIRVLRGKKVSYFDRLKTLY